MGSKLGSGNYTVTYNAKRQKLNNTRTRWPEQTWKKEEGFRFLGDGEK